MRRLYSNDFHVQPRDTVTETDTDCINCPNCNHALEVNDDRWSDSRSDYESGLTKCPVCKKDFVLTVYYVMHLTAHKE